MGMSFSLVSGEEEMDEVVDKLVGDVLRQSSGKKLQISYLDQ